MPCEWSADPSRHPLQRDFRDHCLGDLPGHFWTLWDQSQRRVPIRVGSWGIHLGGRVHPHGGVHADFFNQKSAVTEYPQSVFGGGVGLVGAAALGARVSGDRLLLLLLLVPGCTCSLSTGAGPWNLLDRVAITLDSGSFVPVARETP